MFTSIMGVGSPVGVLIFIVAVLVIAYRFLRCPPTDPIHKGKSPTQCCKFDSREVAATRHLVPPPLILPNLGPADPRVQSVMNAVQMSVVKGALDTLSGEVTVTAGGRSGLIASRNTFGKDVDLAMAYLEEFYQGLGLQTVREPYTARGKTLFNLVATQPGKVSPDKVLILGAHLDSTAGRPSSAEKVAPGADDDGSGTVSLMEIAKALTKLPLGCTVRYVHFTGEEQGLYGSYAYSDKVAEAKTDLIAMIQLDMVGWCAKPGNRLDIHDGKDRNGSHALVGYFVANVSRYGLVLKPVDTHNHAVDNRSDHAGFLDHGYMAVLLSEEFTDDGFNPNYHSVSDKADTVNVPYLIEVIKLALSTAADLAQIQP